MAKKGEKGLTSAKKEAKPKKTSEGNSKMTVFKSKDDKRNKKHYIGQGR